ncbi:MAG: hypothetical protein RBU21_13490 [FCB group bacterium]|jgi:hypothetical protein|nr:hypothetical protein [FCB group bacterium]
MKVVLAGLFVFIGLLVVVAVVGGAGDSGSLPKFASDAFYALMPVFFLGLIAAAYLFFNRGRSYRSPEEHERYLEENGLLVEERYEATRAFNVEEFEDEGSIYFVELKDGRVLFLMGQYLYEYEPIDDGPDNSQPRTFPCTEFTLRRHRDEGYVYDIKCAGEVFEPEVTAPWLGEEVWQEGALPDDGEIISDRSYEDIKREHMERKR